MSKSNTAQQAQVQPLATAQGFGTQTIVAENDPAPGMPANRVEELRERIRSARLENLMARQLEGELQINEMALEPALSNNVPDLSPSQSEPSPALEPEPSVLRDVSQPKSGAWTRSRFHDNRQECEALIREFESQAGSIGRLVERSGHLLQYLDRVEQEFDQIQSSEIELREKTRDLDRLQKQHAENTALIDKQTRQIEMLETMHQSAGESLESAKCKNDQLQAECDRKASRLNEVEALAARLEQENLAVRQRFETARESLEKAHVSVETLRQQNHELDRDLAQTKSENGTLSVQHEQAMHELSALQIKYNELSKRSLAYQGEHYARVNNLEETVRDLRGKLERMTRERDETTRELDAANKLLALHEEMIETLSSQRN